jgi:hypothetical protein
MKNRIAVIASTSTNLLAVQRAKRILRLRYGVSISKLNADPVWLSAYNQ